MTKVKKYSLVLFGFMMIGVGCAFTLKASIGVDAWNALGQTAYDVLGIKVGTVSIIMNCLCVLGEILLLGKDFKRIQLLQVPCNILLGYMINLFLYHVLSLIQVESYVLRVAMFVFGTVWNAFFVALILHIDLVTTALEGFCMAMTRIVPTEYYKIRQAVDVIAIAIILLLVLILKVPSSIREGTVIAAVIFGPVLGVCTKYVEKINV